MKRAYGDPERCAVCGRAGRVVTSKRRIGFRWRRHVCVCGFRWSSYQSTINIALVIARRRRRAAAAEAPAAPVPVPTPPAPPPSPVPTEPQTLAAPRQRRAVRSRYLIG